MMRTVVLGLMAATMLAGPVLAGPRDNSNDNRREYRDDRRDYRDDRRDFRDDQREFRDDRRDFRNDRRDWYRDQRYWRPVGRDDWRWAGPRHRGPAYVWPRGQVYRPWGVGARLEPVYFARPYWVAEPSYFRLPPPVRGSRWVRVGPDALLVQIGNGIVLQAVRGVWW